MSAVHPTVSLPAPSARLAELDFAAEGPRRTIEVLSDEASHALGARVAAVLRFDASVGELQPCADAPQAEVSDDGFAKLFAAPRRWAGGEDLGHALAGAANITPHGHLVSVPLTAQDKRLGILVLDFEHAIDPHDARVAAFARQASAVLANSALLGSLKRRQDELAALYETARELSQRLDLEVVLTAIVERARALVRTPISYIMLVDEPGSEIYMRVTKGTTTHEFSGLRLSIGEGLGGAVAARKHYLYSRDYLNDPQFSHQREVDDAVRRESIRCILGVPLMTSQSFVGVLYVADRQVRSFSEADVAPLKTLADHAAVAIDNASLYEQATAAAAEIERKNQMISAQFRRLERADALNASLTAALLAGRRLQGLVEVMAAFIGEQVVVMDEYEHMRAAAGETADPFGRLLREHGVAGVRKSMHEPSLDRRIDRLETTIIPADGRGRTRARVVVPIVAGAGVLGSLWAAVRPDALDEDRVLVEQGARAVAVEMLMEHAVSETERRVGSEFVSDLLSSRAPSEGVLERRAAELGIALDEPHQLVVVGAAVARRDADRRALGDIRVKLVRRLRDMPECPFVAEWNGVVIALVKPSSDAARTALEEGVAEARNADVPIRIAVSAVCREAAEYRREFLECDGVLRVLGENAAVVDLDEVRVLGLLFRQSGQDELRQFVGSRLGPLMAADEKQEGDLVKTLDAYLGADGSATRAADALHVHVNTVYYRLGKIQELIGDRMLHPPRIIDLRVALLARRFVDVTGDEAPD